MKQLIYTLFTLSALLYVGCTNAGEDQTVAAGTKVILDASDTKTDRGGTITAYEWSQIEDGETEQVHIFDRYTATASFIAPYVKEESKLKFEVITTESYNCKTEDDNSCNHHKSSSKVTITVTPSADANDSSGSESIPGGSYSITATGKVTAQNAQSISGAVVTAGGNTKTTTATGSYTISNITSSQRVVINATHPDYFSNNRVILANNDSIYEQNIQLFKPQSEQTFDTKEGTTISANGATLQLEADANYLDKNSKKYSGNAIIKLSYHTVSDSTGKAAFMGGYEGKDATDAFPLYVHGFVNLSLSDENGNPLRLSNSTATLKFPTSASTNNQADIPVWSFDTSTGYWLKDNNTNLISGSYVAQINKIAPYGLHTRAPAAVLNICVEDTSEDPLSGATVKVTASNWSENITQTDTDGKVSLSNVLAGTPLTVSASKSLDGQLYSRSIVVNIAEGNAYDMTDCLTLGKPVSKPTNNDDDDTNDDNRTN